MGTSIPAVLAALTALAEATLVAADPFPAAQVIAGPFGTVTTHAGRFLVVGSDDQDDPIVGTRETESMGLASVSEDYRIPLGFSVSLPGTDTLPVVIERAMGDLTLIDAALRVDPTLGGVAGQAQLLGDFELKPRADSDGRHAHVTSSVRVRAQTT